VKLLFVSDEENGSEYGAQWLTENCNIFRREDIMLVPDAGSITGDAIEVAEKNIYWVEFTVSGVQAHASRPDNGVNAALAGAELAVRLHDELMAKFDARDPLFEPPFSTFEPTRKSANVPNINTIPGEDIFCVDMRILPCYPIKTVEAEIDRIKREVESKRGVKISAKVHQSMESKPTPQDCRLVRLLSRVVKETYGVETKAIGIGGGTVASYFRNQDIEAAVWCTENGTAHQPNEFTTLANILGDAKVMALLMLDA
jgi:succinyl-diaminopimelate desuccinylase